jgi:hypothetical protein
MPCFHLHIRDGFEVLDEEGQEFASLGDARQAAVASARDMMAADIRTGRLSLGDRIEITDGDGAVLDIVVFRDAVQLHG